MSETPATHTNESSPEVLVSAAGPRAADLSLAPISAMSLEGSSKVVGGTVSEIPLTALEFAEAAPLRFGAGALPLRLSESSATSRFGDFELIREIARGGMGVVYQAHEISLNRIVALKMILAGAFASDADVERFQVEAQAAAKLDHPGIVPVYAVGQIDGFHYYTMPFVEGKNLAQHLVEGPMSPNEAAEVVRQVAQAAQYAHDKGVIHRDLKPQNILVPTAAATLSMANTSTRFSLGATVSVKVTDFGLAKRLEGESGLTHTGQIVGTPSYMPPEQARPGLFEMGSYSDVYSLGAVLYALVTGRPPFQAATPFETLAQVIDKEPVAPRDLNAAIPRDLETICLKCLSKDPRARYQSAQELAEDLSRFLNRESILARPVSWWERTWRWCRRQPAIATLLMLLFVSLASGTTIAWIFKVRADAQAAFAKRKERESLRNANAAKVSESEAQRQLKIAQDATGQLKAERDRLNQILFQTQLQQAYTEWQGGRASRLRDLLNSSASEQVGWEVGWLTQATNKDRRQLLGHAGHVHLVALPADAKQLLSAGRDRCVRLWDLSANRQVHQWNDHRADISCLAVSSDGRWFITGSQDSLLRVGHTANLKGRRTTRKPPDKPTALATVPGKNQFILACEDASVGLWERDGPEAHVLFDTGGVVVNSLATSPTGDWLFGGDREGRLHVWELPTGLKKSTIKAHEKPINRMASDPTGRWVAAASDDASISVWDTLTLSRRTVLRGHSQGVIALAFAAQSSRLLSGDWDSTVIEWDVETSEVVRRLRGHEGRVNDIATSKTNGEIVTAGADSTIRVWDASSKQEFVSCQGHGGSITSVAFSPTDDCVASGSTDYSIRLWNPQTGTSLGQLLGHSSQVSELVFTPDGTQLLSGGGEGDVRLWDTRTWHVSGILTGHTEGITTIALSGEGDVLASGSSDRTVRIWDLKRQTETRCIRDHTEIILAVSVSPNGRLLVSASRDKTVRVWSLPEGRELFQLQGHGGSVRAVAFDRLGKRIATGCDDTKVRVFDAATGKVLQTLKGHSFQLRTVSFHPSESRLISGGLSGQLKLWNPNSGDEVLSMTDTGEPVMTAKFDNSGAILATGNFDGSLRLWHGAKLAVMSLPQSSGSKVPTP